MGTRTRVHLFLIGTWLLFFAFLLLLFLAATDHFSLFTGTAIVVSFVLNWVLSIRAHDLIMLRAKKLRQMQWLQTFKVLKHIPFALNCAVTLYAITWPDLPERERRVS